VIWVYDPSIWFKYESIMTYIYNVSHCININTSVKSVAQAMFVVEETRLCTESDQECFF